MALDTRLKRASAINVASPWRGILPEPDGTVDEVDRPVVAFMYSLEAAAGGGDSSTEFPIDTIGDAVIRSPIYSPIR